MALRPCECDGAACYLCTLYRTSRRYRAAWGGDPADVPAPENDPPPPARRGPCASLGDPIPGATAARLGLSVLRAWHPCAKGRGEHGHVCRCDVAAVCGACPDWTPAD